MVVGANTKFVYTSIDAGYTWYKDTLASSYGVFGDPVIIADTAGAFYYFHLSDNANIHTWPMWADRIVCQRLDDIGTAVWSDGGGTHPTDTPAISDKPGIAIDRKTNTLYATWTNFDRYGSHDLWDSSNIFFSKSADRGNTWSAPVRINQVAGDCTDTDPTVEGAVPCVGPKGEVYVAWASYDKLMFDRSFDGGNTWLQNDIFVNMTAGWDYAIPGLNRCNGLPYSACDLSRSPYRGTIYLNWTDQTNGVKNTDVWLCKSTDHGDTWSTPRKVNNDTGARQQFMSSMTVDPENGHIYVLFYDRRNYGANSLLTDVYIAVSKDGGENFDNFKISETPFLPNGVSFFGDYTFISAAHNVVRPIWGRQDAAGRQKIMTAILDSTVIGTAVQSTTLPSYSIGVAPNPFAANTTISYSLARPEPVSLFVTDLYGRKVAVLAAGQYENAGSHATLFDAGEYHLPPGLYFLSLQTPAFSQTVKIVVRAGN